MYADLAVDQTRSRHRRTNEGRREHAATPTLSRMVRRHPRVFVRGNFHAQGSCCCRWAWLYVKSQPAEQKIGCGGVRNFGRGVRRVVGTSTPL
eukprot:355425-Chlamydomonas_euryale.AAC.4